MKGTIVDFLKLASETPPLSQELVDLAMKHGFEFSGEVSDQELEVVAGGANTNPATVVKVKILWSPPAPTTGSAYSSSLGDESASSSGTASSSYTGRPGTDASGAKGL
jgi:hypothetical protein